MTDHIEWELRASNGTVIKVTDVSFERDYVDVPDCDNPDWFTRESAGPVRITAIIQGTGLD